MFHHKLSDEVEGLVFLKWYMLAFLAGSINAGVFLAAGSFVTHVTGFATMFGIGAANGRWDEAIGILTVPFFFLLGTMLSAYLIDYRFHRGKQPHYDWVMFLEFLCLLVVAAGGHFKKFGIFGEALKLKQDYLLLALLCLASGLQNAAITTASGASVRTTPLTGLTTDLGIGIVRALGYDKHPRERNAELQANWVRLGTIIAYIGGSLIGAALFIRLDYLGFLLPACLALYAMFQAIKEKDYLGRR